MKFRKSAINQSHKRADQKNAIKGGLIEAPTVRQFGVDLLKSRKE